MKETHYQLDLLKAMNQNLSARDRMYRLLCDMTDGAFLYFDMSKNEMISIGKWEDYFGFQIEGKRDVERLFELMDEPYVIPLRDLFSLEKEHGTQASLECLTRRKKNWFRFQACVIYDQAGKPTDKAVSIVNITKYKLQAEELDYYSYYDIITGLFNRNYFVRLLGEFLQRAEKNNERVSVLMLDIDDFHKVNDGLGMIYGDELIQQFGFVLKDLCSEKVIACHLNSDIYCMAVYSPDESCSADTLHERIRSRVKRPFFLGGNQSVQITVTVGIAEYPEAAKNALELINCAEIVTLKGKALGKNSVLYFDTPILNEFMMDLELEAKLKEALSEKSFELFYQPQFYAGNQKLRGVEALIRWRDANDKLISPAVFIPLAEKNGSIISIGNWVMEESIRQYRNWRVRYGVPFLLSVNVSAKQFNQPDFVDHLLSLFDQYQIDPYDVELEMTESILIEDFASVCDKLRVLQEKGVRISLDDFGTGFSSLSYLKKLPINTLKIDKSFIDTVLTDSVTRIITESIVNMVKSLGFETIAEGVEEEQQYKYLHAIGCDVIQGYYFGRPLSVGKMDELLQVAGDSAEESK